jgi:glutamate-1-semialdehyde 2,1-aminomutase
MQGRINARLRENGVLKGDTKFYVSVAHTPADVAHTLEAFRKAVMAE